MSRNDFYCTILFMKLVELILLICILAVLLSVHTHTQNIENRADNINSYVEYIYQHTCDLRMIKNDVNAIKWDIWR